MSCGTTAIGAFVGDNGDLLVFNIGDSHAVLCRGGRAVSSQSNDMYVIFMINLIYSFVQGGYE